MECVVHIPQSLPDAMQRSPEEFARDARMGMAVKHYEMKRLYPAWRRYWPGYRASSFCATCIAVASP